MSWGALWAAITGFLTAMLPYLKDLMLVLAGKELQTGLDAKETLKEVKKANESVAAIANDDTAKRLQRLSQQGRVRD